MNDTQLLLCKMAMQYLNAGGYSLLAKFSEYCPKGCLLEAQVVADTAKL
jgi:hypothetical protein